MIHPQAIVDPAASLARSVTIGAFSVIGPDVEIDEETSIGPHVVINGPTVIGKKNKIFQFTSLGDAPQHAGYKGEPTKLIIGDDNIIREYTSMNRGSQDGRGTTLVGNDNFFMAYCHVAHDCQVGNHTVFANGASLAGHVEVGDYVILGGFSLVHQFCKVGAHSITAINTVVFKDIPPYLIAAGYGAEPHGLNLKGLRHRNFSTETIKALKDAYKTVYRSGFNTDEALEQLKALAANQPDVANFIKFISQSERGIIRS